MLLPFNEFRRILTALSNDQTLTLEQARAKASQGRRWSILISNTQEGSNKFWEASGSTLTAPVTIFWGKLHTPGRSITKDWAYVEKAVPAKLRKGYVYGMPEVSEKQALDKAAAYAAKSLDLLVKMAQNFDRKGLPNVRKNLEVLAKKHDLNLDPLYTLLWKEATGSLAFFKKELESRKKAVAAALGVKINVSIPSIKPKKLKASGGKQASNPEALQELLKQANQILKYLPPVKNYWEYVIEKIPSQMEEEMDSLASTRPALAKVQKLVSGQDFEWAVGEWANSRPFEVDLRRVLNQLGGM